MNNLGAAKKLGAIDPKGGKLLDDPDHGGGFADSGPTGKTVHPAKGAAPKVSMVDGPYGGKKPQSGK
jgi:hypothetical protein